MGDVPAASRSGAVVGSKALFELEEPTGVGTRGFAALLDLDGAEGAAGDGVRRRRGFPAASGLACMLAVVECGIPSESVGERTEDRGEDALASAGEG